MVSFNWSWADYERCKRAEERRACKEVEAQEVPTADDASGCKGRAPEGSSGPAPAKVAPSPHVAVKARQSRVKYEPRPVRKPFMVPPPASLFDDRPCAPFEPGAKIDISAAPSGMEAAAARWEGMGAAPGRLAQAVPVLCEGKVLCRCGAQGPGQTRGPVPVWFGDKCIEAKCELRGDRCAAPQARPRAAANAAKPSGADATRPAFEGRSE
jgi:hypothetical protein